MEGGREGRREGEALWLSLGVRLIEHSTETPFGSGNGRVGEQQRNDDEDGGDDGDDGGKLS